MTSHRLNRPDHPAAPAPAPSLPPIPRISEGELRRALGSVLQQDLQPILLLAGLGSLAYAGGVIFQGEAAARVPLANTCLAAGGFSLVAWVLMKLDVIGASLSHLIATVLAAIVLGGIYLQGAGHPSPEISIQLVLFLVVAGYLVLFVEWYLPILLAALGIWYSFAWTAKFADGWPQSGVVMILAALISSWIHSNRSKTQRQFQTLRLEESPQRLHLLKVAEQARRESLRFQALWDLGFDALILHDQGEILDANTAACELIGYERDEIYGTSIADYVDGQSKAEIEEMTRLGSFRTLQASGLHKNGTPLPLQLFNKTVPWGEEKLSILVLRDLTGQKRHEELVVAEKHRVERVLRRQSALDRIELALDQSGSLDDFCRQIAEAAAVLTQASIGACLLLREQAEATVAVRASTVPQQVGVGRILSAQDPGSALGFVLNQREPLIVPDTLTDSFGLKEALALEELKAYAAVPAGLHGEIAGLLLVLEAETRHYTPEEMSYLDILASRLAAALRRRESEERFHNVQQRLEEQHEEILRLKTTLAKVLEE